MIFPVHLSLAQSGRSGEPEKYVSIDFNDVDLAVFIKFISELTGKNFIIDQRVRGKVTIISPSKISVDDAYKVFLSVLEVNGFTAVEAGEVVKIVSFPEAPKKNIETLLKDESRRGPDDKVVTQLIQLKYAEPNDIKQLFTPLLSKGGILQTYDSTNMVIVTDLYSNIKRFIRILNVIDVEGIGLEISVISLEYADAEKMVKTLTTVFQQQKSRRRTKRGSSSSEEVIKLVADERTNKIVLLASEYDTIKIKELISQLDKEVPRGKGKIHVYYLENASAEDLAKVLQSLSTKTKSTSAKGKKEAPIVSEAVNITADKATNSLIIMAEKDDYVVLEEVIRKLDIPRAMVYIECLIMEVNVDKGFKLGTEWMAGGKTDINGKTSYFGGGYSGIGGEDGYQYITSAVSSSTGIVNPFAEGLSLGIFGEYIKVGELSFPNLGAMIQAYKKDKNIYILSTPQLMTMDNEEASITVGKNVPYQTREGTSSTTTDSSTYNTYEYKDVAIILTITPQISKDRQIRLKISQEVSRLDSTAASSENRPTTLKRTIDTTVVVNDNNTIALGGLIDDSFSTTEYKMPCIGDVPGLGWLFKSMSRGREKTNLFVFLTPHVIENADEAEKFYQKKKEEIDSAEEGNESIKLYRQSSSVPIEDGIISEEELDRTEELKEELKMVEPKVEELKEELKIE